MSYKFLAATSATILTLAISIPTTQAQTADASKKKIQNITNYNAVQPSTGTAKAPVVFTQPRVNHTDLRTAAPRHLQLRTIRAADGVGLPIILRALSQAQRHITHRQAQRRIAQRRLPQRELLQLRRLRRPRNLETCDKEAAN
jgi:hypothetical protein